MITRTMAALLSICMYFLLFVPEVFAANKFGVIFELKGNVRIQNDHGLLLSLDQEKDILHSIKEGDRIEVFGEGKVVIVSSYSKNGYEIASNSAVIIKDNKLTTLHGSVRAIEGLHPPGDDKAKQGHKGIGAVVMRSSKKCIKIVSPVNTAILDISPDLTWQNSCRDNKKVSIKVLHDDMLVYETSTDATNIKIPAGILHYGMEYRWLVDGGESGGTKRSGFSIPDKQSLGELRDQVASYSQLRDAGIAQRLSYLFFLREHDLNDLARSELEGLRKEYPQNNYLKELDN